MNWVTYQMISSFIFATGNVADKFILNKWIDNPFFPVMVVGILNFILSIVIFFTHGYAGFSAPDVFLCLLSGVLYMLVLIYYFKAVQIGEVSRLVPVYSAAPLLIALLAAVFLGEIFSAGKYLGILLLVSGAVLISTKDLRSFKIEKAMKFVLVSAGISAANSVLLKHLLNNYGYWQVFGLARAGSMLALVPVFLNHYANFTGTIKKHGGKVTAIVAINEAFGILAGFFSLLAASSGYITLVSALSSVHPFFVLMLTVTVGIFYPDALKEEINRRNIAYKLLAIAMIFTGAVLTT